MGNDNSTDDKKSKPNDKKNIKYTKKKETKKKSDNKKSKKNDKKKNNEGTGFFGNFKWRVFVMGILFIALGILQLPLISKNLDTYSEAADVVDVAEPIIALSLVEAALALMIIASACAIAINLLNCNDCCGCIDNCLLFFVSIALVTAGLFYMAGYWMWLDYAGYGFSFGWLSVYLAYIAQLQAATSSLYSTYGAATTTTFYGWGGNNFQNAMKAVCVGESILVGISAIVFGVDCFSQMLNDQKKRMYAQSILLLTFVGALLFGCFAYLKASDGWGCICAGYFFIFVSCVIYLVMNFKEEINTKVVQICVAIALIFGGVLAAIGYWDTTAPSVPTATTGYGYSYDNDEGNSWIVGYSFFLLGICIMNAFDMGLYSNIRNGKKK